ncbi:hypothetical protein [Lysobacter antibioticus]|uniref:hypothetical protein n=1 Tax=Lysobacter antibioticus TaxID=84531 RepID=UPI0014706544|nr:hypothetical protein [Lysobacter antibioticus]
MSIAVNTGIRAETGVRSAGIRASPNEAGHCGFDRGGTCASREGSTAKQAAKFAGVEF